VKRWATGLFVAAVLSFGAVAPMEASAVIGTCDPATRGDSFNSVTIEEHAPNLSGSILVDVKYGWDGVSVKPSCDGPVSSIRLRNTSTQTAWANLPNKKKGNLWQVINPGTDVTTSNQGQLNNLGLSNYSDVAAVTVVFTQPA